MSTILKRLSILALVFILSFVSFYFFRQWQQGRLFGLEKNDPGQYVQEDYTMADTAPLEASQVPGLDRQNDEMITLVDKVTPSVVSITTEIVKTERFLDPARGRIFERSRLTPGLGSGVIVSKEGHVITNNHVIEGQQKIMVTLHDGRTLPAILINTDRLLDIAVLRIQADGPFVPLKFSDSDEVKVGQIAIAVGNPFGLGETVTVGRISARDRSLSDGQRDMLQTDAAINPGNSGGPLINYLGEIIGINASIYSADRENPGFQGIGFSIPANDVRRTFQHILDKGRPVYGYLGLLQVEDLNNRFRSVFQYQGDGVLIVDVVVGSPAEKAGLQPYDIVTAYNNEGVTVAKDFLNRVQRSNIGSQVPISVWRGGKTVNLTATLGEYDPLAAIEPAAGSRVASDQTILRIVGLQVQDLAGRNRALGYRGVIAAKILPGSLAEKAGFQPGDQIVSVNQVAVTNGNDFYMRLVSSAGVQDTLIGLFRNKQPLQITLPRVPRANNTD